MSNRKRDPTQLKREYRASMDSACKLYNSGLQQLTYIACHMAPTDDNISKIRDTLRAILAVDETIVIIQSGPYIWKYREQIAKKEEQFFLNNTFDDDISNMKKQINTSGKDFSNNEIATIMTNVKSIYGGLSGPEQETIWTHVINLLRAYAQYIGAERKLKEIEEEIRKMLRDK
jgi:hypothetical protein